MRSRKLTPYTHLRAKKINELSGLARSRRSAGVLWCHNDSGDSSRLFAVRTEGTLLSSEKGVDIAGTRNNDWEDIAIDRDGTLYIADMGNNSNRRTDLGIYALPEPEPGAPEAEGARFYPVRYPDQVPGQARTNPRFDCEALFVYRGKPHLLTKERLPGGIGFPSDTTTLYRLDTRETGRVNALTRVQSRAKLGGWVTGADVSPDEHWLVVLCQLPTASVWLFPLGKTGEKLLSGQARRVVVEGVGQAEAICFENDRQLILGNEKGELFRLPLDAIPLVVP
jgi:sugar lactone lactonase YvrE